jgi:menaquinone-dependent protoporphyrinogen oxidase
MTVLVAFASKHGSTREIALRIAGQLERSGVKAVARPVKDAGELSAYDAFVVGSALYFGSWMKEASDFVRAQAGSLANRPLWLFSSGPLGTSPTDEQGRDQRVAALPKEANELAETTRAREHHVFFGALDHRKFDFGERLIALLPVGKKLLQEGDFRDWEEVDAWSATIARDLPRQGEPA